MPIIAFTTIRSRLPPTISAISPRSILSVSSGSGTVVSAQGHIATNAHVTRNGRSFRVVFGDGRDLGYGRRMTARQNPDGTLAFFVENYLIDPSGSAGYNLRSASSTAVGSSARISK